MYMYLIYKGNLSILSSICHAILLTIWYVVIYPANFFLFFLTCNKLESNLCSITFTSFLTDQWVVGHALFNDALNTFYLWLNGVTHMVTDHSDSERGNPLPPHTDIGYSFRLAARVLLYASSQDNTISRSSQCSTTGITKAVVCAILSVGWCI